MKRRISFLLFAVLTGIAPAQDKTTLKMEWQPGARYTQRLDVSHVVGIPRHGEAKAATLLVVALSADKKSPPKQISASCDTLKVHVDMPRPKPNEEFDSAKPTEGHEGIADLYAKLKTANLGLKLDATGGISDVLGLDALTGGEDVLLERFLGKNQIKSFLQSAGLLAMPKEAVAKGDRWPFRMDFPTPLGTLSIKGQYEVLGDAKSEGKDCLEIKVSGEVSGNFTPQPVKPTGDEEADAELERMQLLIKTIGVSVKSGTVTGKVFYDKSARHLSASDIETNLILSVEKYPENGQPAEIPINQKVKMTLARQS